LAAERPGEHLAGIALCTSDDANGVLLAGCTDPTDTGNDPDMLFQPVDWSFSKGSDGIELANREIQRAFDDVAKGNTAAFGEFREAVWDALTAAIRLLRRHLE